MTTAVKHEETEASKAELGSKLSSTLGPKRRNATHLRHMAALTPTHLSAFLS